MLVCPDCRCRLARGRAVGDPQWRCPEGHGCALAVSTIERLARPEVVRELRDAIRRPLAATAIACPSCRRISRHVELRPGGLLVAVDVCRSCDVVWFDSGELEQLPRKARYTAPSQKDAAVAIADFRRELASSRVRLEGELERARAWDFEASLESLSLPEKALVLFDLPVEIDRPGPRGVPWLTWTLATALVAIFLACERWPGVARTLAWIPAEPWRLGGLTAITTFLVHADPWHLLSNVYFLLVFGDDVEERFGRFRLLLVLVLATVLGSMLHAGVDPRPGVRLVGASSGISGVLVWYVAAWPRQRIAIAFWLRRGYFVVTASAFVLFVVWIALQLCAGFLQSAGVGRVSAIAHLGGAIAGVLTWLAWRVSHAPAEPPKLP